MSLPCCLKNKKGEDPFCVNNQKLVRRERRDSETGGRNNGGPHIDAPLHPS